MILAPQIFNVMRIFYKALCGKIGDFKFSATLDITRRAHKSNNKHTTPVFSLFLSVWVTPMSISPKPKSRRYFCLKQFFKKFHCLTLFTYSALLLEQCEGDLNKPSKTWVGSSQSHTAFCPPAELNFLQPLESLLPLRSATTISSIWGTYPPSGWLQETSFSFTQYQVLWPHSCPSAYAHDMQNWALSIV